MPIAQNPSVRRRSGRQGLLTLAQRTLGAIRHLEPDGASIVIANIFQGYCPLTRRGRRFPFLPPFEHFGVNFDCLV